MKHSIEHKVARRLVSLAQRKADLEERIRREMNRPIPCSFTLRHLKTLKLSIKDRMSELEALTTSAGEQKSA